ncbi:uncharacterized protein ColSpa_10211 [Colletotrichum spaethianum]|uniref:Uncharacterized protein n=1 Tax=Colletotrichum spaethianum TaxID=700344 RepID=A0AA37PD16_9PEZI|nr:uncharacterized protein ColSpa_10211 [Colletotrichum spaethianum]GKT50030.1 hypothetical protein ColSpa_10211 [Colletotrichum spaethianum]
MRSVSSLLNWLDLPGVIYALACKDPTLCKRLMRVQSEVGITALAVRQPDMEAEKLIDTAVVDEAA